MNEIELAEFVNLVSDLLDYVEPCEVDPQRPFCITHHQRYCESDGLVKELSRIIERYRSPGSEEEK